MTLLQIAQLGHPVLRKKALPVPLEKIESLSGLITDLMGTLKDINGVGISAPQVYRSQRIFIVASNPNPRYPNAPKMKPTPMINPTIVSHSEETAKDWEGCLSIPGIRGLVPRYVQITVQYTNPTGKHIRRSFRDFVARIVQHEHDHLEGLLFTDRIESTRDLVSEKEYQRIIASNEKKKTK